MSKTSVWHQLCASLILCLGWSTALTADKRDPSVGMPGHIDQIILPGTELAARPLDDDRIPVVVRIVNVFPHGDSFRYDIRFHGLEPGKFNLAEFLVRKDGASTADLPEIPVEILSLLPPGQIEPNNLRTGLVSWLGGYDVLVAVAVTLWTIVLGCLIFLGRKKKSAAVSADETMSLAELLQNRLQAAVENRMDPKQYAELERMLFAFWRARLDLESLPPDQAVKEIHANPDAGPLMKQLEQWMHSPNRNDDVDLAKLLEPFRNLPAAELEFETSVEHVHTPST